MVTICTISLPCSFLPGSVSEIGGVGFPNSVYIGKDVRLTCNWAPHSVVNRRQQKEGLVLIVDTQLTAVTTSLRRHQDGPTGRVSQ